ncbi:hypothetical protein ACFPAF_17135 [Hymenobacter endophyticus]|uniref:Uncharacterized protein n=1 Tax=Hymenobacter endophyticus TaxID=3076335 RepID=A0ABU3TL86_9BACT|nr:hypothetical protein [Hymenobacter endophyticus]MDU0372130.1 hypothetical protein [Hymenobacter endophyticus]
MTTLSPLPAFVDLLVEGVEFVNEFDGYTVLKRSGNSVFEYDTRWPESVTETPYESPQAAETAAWKLCKLAHLWVTATRPADPMNQPPAAAAVPQPDTAGQPPFWPTRT